MGEKKNCELLFLGTGAADWNGPEADGSLRRFSCALVNGHILIDCPQHAMDSLLANGIRLEDVNELLITHSHPDHLNLRTLAEIALRRHEADCPPLSVHCSRAIARRISETDYITATPLTPSDEFGIKGGRIKALAANHESHLPGEIPLHYLFMMEDGPTWYYAVDGGWMLYDTWQELREHELDAWVVDSTTGIEGDERCFEHNSVEMLRVMLKTMLATGVLKTGAPVFMTHLARTLHPSHDVLVARMEPPFIVAYDGLDCALERIPTYR